MFVHNNTSISWDELNNKIGRRYEISKKEGEDGTVLVERWREEVTVAGFELGVPRINYRR